MTGYTVVDLETTGLFPRKHDRVVEIALVSLSDDGVVEGEWSTLVNPERDVGPTSIHGITARDVHGAPTFAEIAPYVVSRLAGRTLVAHNARFDTQFLDHELTRARAGTLPPTPSLCTMQLSSSYLRGASRKLRDCCAAADVEHRDEHSALGDARAAAGLLRYYLARAGVPLPWQDAVTESRAHWWPGERVAPGIPRTVGRVGAARAPDAWLDRISSALPRNPDPRIEAYLAVLEQAMLDGYLSAREEDALIMVAADLGMQRDQIAAVHAMFLDAMTVAAWADGVVTEAERSDLDSVAAMLGLPRSLVQVSLDRSERVGRATGPSVPCGTPARTETSGRAELRLRRGDQVVFTGDLSVPRAQLVEALEATGLKHGGVTRSTRVVVAADPDSLSGKAAKAHQYGIPVITEAAFVRLLSTLE